MIRVCVMLALLWACAACQTTPVTPEMQIAQPSPRPTLLRQPTLMPRLIVVPTIPATTADTDTPDPILFPSPLPAATLPPLDPVLLTRAAPPAADESVIGTSAEGREISERRFGSGSRVLMLIGGMHGGWEANTVTLMQQVIDHFSAQPQDVPPGVSLLIVPVANPDGLAYGRIPRGRFNGDDVDLNRNWSCEWSSAAFWRQERVNPGLSPFSEPETVALAHDILRVRPAALLFYHSAADGVFAGSCGNDSSAAPEGYHGSAALAAVVGKAAGYPYDAPFTAYPVTGDAANWADSQGIPSADIELQSETDSEYDRNLRGVLAVIQWLSAQP